MSKKLFLVKYWIEQGIGKFKGAFNIPAVSAQEATGLFLQSLKDSGKINNGPVEITQLQATEVPREMIAAAGYIPDPQLQFVDLSGPWPIDEIITVQAFLSRHLIEDALKQILPGNPKLVGHAEDEVIPYWLDDNMVTIEINIHTGKSRLVPVPGQQVPLDYSSSLK